VIGSTQPRRQDWIELRRDGREEIERLKRDSAPYNDGSANRWDINNSMFLPIENY